MSLCSIFTASLRSGLSERLTHQWHHRSVVSLWLSFRCDIYVAASAFLLHIVPQGHNANFPDQNVQRPNVTSLETARSLANGPKVAGAEREFPGNCIVSYLSFGYGSTGRVCGRSLTAGKILFTRMQAFSLYLVLWLCDMNGSSNPSSCVLCKRSSQFWSSAM